MDARRLGRCLAVGALVATVLTACSNGGDGMSMSQDAGIPDDATVTYAFHDSSVPPAYHRSETLSITRERARLVIDSYGDVLADETVSTPSEVWDTLGASVGAMAALAPVEPDEGCVGGTGMDLRIESDGSVLVDLSPQFCGGSNDALEEPIVAWIAPARSLFPPTDVLAPEGE